MGEFFSHLGSNISYQFVLIFLSLIWARFLALFSVLPVLVGKPVPMSVRVGLSLVLALFMLPMLFPTNTPVFTENPFLLGALFLKEVLIGVVIGLMSGLMFFAFEAAGNMIDNQRGMSNARLLIPELGTMGSPISMFLFLLTISMYFALGGHLMLLESIMRSFIEIPVLTFPQVVPGWMPLIDFAAITTGRLLELSITIAAPVVMALLLSDIILGIANRVAPQLNVWDMSFSLKGYVGIALLYMMLLFLRDTVNQEFATHRQVVDRVQILLRGGARESAPETPEAPPEFPQLPWQPDTP